MRRTLTISGPWGSLVAILIVLATMLAAPTGCSGKSKAQKLHNKGMILYKFRNYYKAIEQFEEALDIKPDRVSTLAVCAEAYLQTGKPGQAIEYAERALQQEPQRTDLRGTVGQAHLALALGDELTTVGLPTVVAPEHLDRATQIASQLRREQPDAIEGLMLQAQIDRVNQKYDDARRLYEELLQQMPENDDARLGLIETYMLLNEFDRAEQMARRMIERTDHPPPEAVAKLATTLALQEKYDAAYEVLQPWIAQENKTPDLSHYLLAGDILLTQLKNLDQAEPLAPSMDLQLQDQLTTRTEPADTHQQQQVVERLADMAALMKGRYPNIPQAWFYRGVSYQMQDKTDEAILHFEKACQRAPGDRRFRLALAMSRMENENYEGARNDLRVLLRTHPGDPDARFRIAQCYAAEGNYGEAIDLLRDLHAEYPDRNNFKSLLGRLLVLTGDPDFVAEGIQMLAESSQYELKAGGKEFLMAQNMLREAQKALADRDPVAFPQKLDRAQQLLNDVVRLQPDNYLAHVKLSQLAELRGNLVSALEHARRAARIDANMRPFEARLYARLGQQQAAIALYKQIVEENPETVAHRLALARLEETTGNTPTARQMYERILQQHPDHLQACLALANLLAREEGPDRAIAYLQAHAEPFAESFQFHLALAELQIKNGHTSEAAETLQTATRILEQLWTRLETEQQNQRADQVKRQLATAFMDLAAMRLLNDQETLADRAAEKGMQYHLELEPQARILMGMSRLTDSRVEEALHQMNRAGRSGQMPPSGYLIISVAHLAGGNIDDARAVLQDNNVLERLNKETLRIYRRMLERQQSEQLAAAAPHIALLLYLSENPIYLNAAMNQCERALEILPDEPFLLTRKAQLLKQQGKADAAIQVYEHLRQVSPETDLVLLALADLHQAKADLALVRGQPPQALQQRQRALEVCQQFLERNPGNLEGLNVVSALYQQLGQFEQANRVYRQIIQTDPDKASPYNNLAWNLAQVGRMEEAARLGEKALQLAPNQPEILDTVGWIEFKNAQYDAALDKLRRAARGRPNNPDIRFHLAQALAGAGEDNEAVEQLESIVHAMPGYHRINDVKARLRELKPDSAALSQSGP